MNKKKSDSELVSNRKARYDYEILETMEAGIMLLGSEIKSLRNHGGSLQDAYVDARTYPPLLINCSIAPYSHGGVFNHEEKRKRHLLLHKREIAHLQKQSKEKNFVIIPLSIFLNAKGIAKVLIGVAKPKKAYDKRAALKEKAVKKDLEET
jgi:SsrA-binding protein